MIDIDPHYHWYDPEKSCCARKGTDEYGWILNMTGGYPIISGGLLWKSSEALYQACRFPDHPEVQEAIREATNGFTAKLVAKSKKHLTRSGWEEDGLNIEAMLYCIYAKIASNPRLWDYLEATQLKPIVEISGKGDMFWGTSTKEHQHYLRGANMLGKLWMYVRYKNLPTRTLPVAPRGLLPGKDIFEVFENV